MALVPGIGMGICPPFGGAGAFDEEIFWWNDENAVANAYLYGLHHGWLVGSAEERQQMLQLMAFMGLGGRHRGGRRFGRGRNNAVQRIMIQQAMGGLGGGMGGFGVGGFGGGIGGFGGMGGIGGFGGGMGSMGGIGGFGGRMGGLGGMGGIGGFGMGGMGGNAGLLMGSPFGFIHNPWGM